jgi:hypothetical protein
LNLSGGSWPSRDVFPALLTTGIAESDERQGEVDGEDQDRDHEIARDRPHWSRASSARFETVSIPV